MTTVTKEQADTLIMAIEKTVSPLVAADIRTYITQLEAALKKHATIESALAKAVDGRTEYQKPLLDRLEQLVNVFDQNKDKIFQQQSTNAQLEERVKVLEETLSPFGNAASKYRDIGDSPVADYIKLRTGRVAGYCTVFVKLCADSTSPKNWFDAADAIAGGKEMT